MPCCRGKMARYNCGGQTIAVPSTRRVRQLRFRPSADFRECVMRNPHGIRTWPGLRRDRGFCVEGRK